ncbi:MAG: DUF3426 domain-containing protein [Gammaproteobacteria bacterium]|nr:DUF3426 domain-containing protein [Gammaproteobacteria bacterium]
MFTQCPDCQTIFELGIVDLKAADGQVCCGECNRVFNALASLTDVPPGTHEELRAHADASAQSEIAEAEYTPEGVSGNLFEDEPDEAEDGDEDSHWAPDDQGLAEDEVAGLERARWEQKLAELGLDPDEQNADEAQDTPPGDKDDQEPSEEDEAADEDADEPESEADWLLPPKKTTSNWRWAVGAVIAGIALLVQSVHFWRADLAAAPVFGQWLNPVYSSLGAPLPENWDVSAYSVAKDTVSDYPEVAGALLVNATIANEADRAQPHPLLKITLLDRWGEPIGERFFAANEYLAEMSDASKLIRPGETKLASMLIMDPGAGAVSYGIDACLRDDRNRLVCAHGRDY